MSETDRIPEEIALAAVALSYDKAELGVLNNEDIRDACITILYKGDADALDSRVRFLQSKIAKNKAIVDNYMEL